MSLRPRTPGTRTTLAQSRMAPGGRRWSEAPIARVGRRRVRTANPVVPAAPTFIERNTKILTAGETSWELNAPDYSPAVMTDYVVAWVVMFGATITPPAGWTTIASGSEGNVNYWVGWADTSTITDWTLTVSSVPSYNNNNIVTQWYNGGNLHPVATIPLEYSAVDTAAFGQPDPAWFLRQQVTFIRYEVTTYYKYGPYNATLTGAPAVKNMYFNHDEVYPGNLTFFSDSGRTIPTTVTTVVAMGIGWAP